MAEYPLERFLFVPTGYIYILETQFLLRSTIVDLETMRTPYEPSSRGYMALTTAISILRQMLDLNAVDKPKLKLVEECND